MKILEIMNSIKDHLVNGFRSGVIPLIIFISILSTVFLLGSVGYYIFPTSTVEGKVVKFTKDARSNQMYEVSYKVNNKEYSTFNYVTNEKVEIGQVRKVIYYDFLPDFSKTVD